MTFTPKYGLDVIPSLLAISVSWSGDSCGTLLSGV